MLNNWQLKSLLVAMLAILCACVGLTSIAVRSRTGLMPCGTMKTFGSLRGGRFGKSESSGYRTQRHDVNDVDVNTVRKILYATVLKRCTEFALCTLILHLVHM